MKNIIFIFLIGFPFGSYAQLENRWWFFGDKAGLDFYYSNPILVEGKTSNSGASAVFSDSLGKLWLYSDGFKVWNASHQELFAGVAGNPTSTQSALFVPDPLDSNNVYLFTTQVLGGKISISHFQFRPSFQVLNLNQTLLIAASEKIHGIKVPNKKSYLIFSHEWNSSRYVHWKLDSTGFYGPFYQNIGAYHGTPGGYNAKGWLKISQNGKFLASNIEYNGKMEIFNLDIQTGNLSNERNISIVNPYGLAFSPSSDYLYLTNQFFGTGGIRENQIWQVSTATLNKILVGSWSGSAFSPDYIIGAIQNGLDGRLYIAKESHNFLATISFPEKNGTNCQFQFTGQDLYGKYARRGLPNILAQDLLPPLADFSFIDRICMGQSTLIQPITQQSNVSFQWNITGPSGHLQSTLPTWNPIFDSAGVHTIQLTVQSNTKSQTIQKQIVVLPIPTRNFASSYTLCQGDTIILQAGNMGATYFWSNGFTSNQIAVTQSGKVKLRVYYQAGTCDSTFETQINFVPQPIFNIPDSVVCDTNFLELTAPLSGTYLWSNQSTQAINRIEQTGKYWLEIFQGDCSFRDSFEVKINQNAEKNKDSVIYFCPLEYAAITIQALPSVSYQWSSGSTNDNITVSDTGTYWVHRLTASNCVFVDSFQVKFNCQSPYFPNSFTPGGKNPEFQAIHTDWLQGNLTIYNRWGEKIFEGEKWDGGNSPEGTYMYVWKGVAVNGEKNQKIGSVLLMR